MSATTNAANAQHSTGPKTQAGKDRVKLNAVKSGLYAQTVILTDENRTAYEALGAALHEDWKPITDTERKALLELQNARWRYDRAAELDSSLFAIGAQQHLENISEHYPDLTPSEQFELARGAGYLANARTFDQLWRQEGRLRRALDRAEREMSYLVSARPPQAPQPTATPSAEPTSTPEPAPPAPPAGFVPAKLPAHMPAFAGKKAKQHRRAWLIKNGFANQTTNMA